MKHAFTVIVEVDDEEEVINNQVPRPSTAREAMHNVIEDALLDSAESLLDNHGVTLDFEIV